MIPKQISHKVLSMGPDCVAPKGGIGMVLNTYSGIYEEFKFISTHREGNVLTKIWVFTKAICLLIPHLCGKEVEVVHIHGASKGSFVRKSILIMLSKAFGKKVIYHIHGGGFKDFTYRHRKCVPYILHKCDMIIALSDYWKSFFADEMHCCRVEIVPNIMEYPKENHHERDKGVFTLLFLGKICKEKGIFDLIEVISEHIDELEGKIKLFIAGIGETDRLQDVIHHLKLDETIKYMGWVSGPDKIELLNKSDAFVLPSYYEGVPISLLEAFSYHLPVISTNVGGIPEILTDGVNGIMVAPGDHEGLYQAIARLASSVQLREQMGKEAYKRCVPHLPENVETRLVGIYKQVFNQ
ncbi:MAG: glycosyltransferase family 4 protein [Prevotella sp.]|nr:glycosyltransferase family 4 protein [Prevotella sp.]